MPDRNTGTVFKLPEMNYCLIIMVITHASGIQGFNRICQANQTMFIPKGDSVTFTITNIKISFFKSSSLHRMDRGFGLMTLSFTSSNISNANARYLHPSIENRTLVSGDFDLSSRTLSNLKIEFQNINMADNGTYIFYDEDIRTTFLCWILFVMEIKQHPIGAIGVAEGMRVVAEPKSSLMVRPLVNATVVWLIDGRNIKQTERFLVQDGAVWAPNLPRSFHGKNVTYRVLQENGHVADVNITLMIRYGPDRPLSIYPEKTYYSLGSGDIVPDISCHADCYPPCSVTWGQHSSDHILRLNQVFESSTGEYTCTATASKGDDETMAIVTRTIFVNVIDQWSISLNPPNTTYFISVGESIPAITCSSVCFPQCDVSWSKHGVGNILQLTSVTEEMSGEYVCSATRNDTSKRIDKAIIVYVKDDVAFTAGLAVVASVQGITTLILVICGVCFCVRAKRDKRCECVRSILLMCPCREAAKHYESETNTKHKKFTEMKNYEDLDDGTRCVSSVSNTYSKVMSEALTTDKAGNELEIYVNTAI